MLLATSLAAAFGNYVFLIGLERPLSYMFALSISSFFAGGFCYAVLPNLIARLTPSRLLVAIVAILAFGCIAASGSRTGMLVFLTIYMFLMAEIILARQNEWVWIAVLRVSMMVTGGLSWLMLDAQAIVSRAVIISLIVAVCLIWWQKRHYKPKSDTLPSKTLLMLVAVNLVWVYLFPLMLVIDTVSSQQTVLYVVTTLMPLIYFKAQDVIFKLDILSSEETGGAPLLFLFIFAVPLGLFYLALVYLQYIGAFQADLLKVMLFSFFSISFLLSNIILTNKLWRSQIEQVNTRH